MRRILGGLLLVQVLVMGSVAVLAPVLYEGIGPEDEVFLQSEYEARARLAGVVIGVLVVLSSVALAYAVQWTRNRDGDPPWPLVIAHLGAAVALGFFHRPVSAALLVLLGGSWWGLDAFIRARRSRPGRPLDTLVGAS